MATTSLWRVTRRLDHMVDYVKNPEKTENPERAAATGQTLDDVIAYASREEATNMKQLVKGINIDPARKGSISILQTRGSRCCG